MERDEAAKLLQSGHQLDGIVLSSQGVILARGKIAWKGTVLSTVVEGTATQLQLSRDGRKLTVPLVHRLNLKRGEPIEIEFGPAWQRQKRRA